MQIGKSNGFYVDVYSRHLGVTGSCFLNSVHWPNGKNVRFLVDAGAAQGEDNEGFFNSFFPFNCGKIEFIILTHEHHDHQGLLPIVVRQGFNGPIFTHYATSKLMNVSLYDCCNIKDSMALCEPNEVEKTLDLVVGCSTKRILKPDKNIRIIFYTNGHLVGAVLTLVVITCPGEEDINLIYTGDYNNKNIFFNVEQPPKEVRNLNISTIFCESTYGNVDSTNPMFNKCLQDNTVKALQNGMSVVYPAFSRERCQEALYYIKIWKNRKLIPEFVNVYLDGKSAQQYTMNYMYTDLGIKKIMKNFMPKNVHFIPRSKDRMLYRRKIMADPDPKIIISSGGMASYGPVQEYINYYLDRDDALIHLLGYCSPSSKGYELFNTANGNQMYYKGNIHTKRCIVEKTAELSSHAPRNILLNFLQSFPNTKSIVINHGELSTKESFREYLLEHLDLPEEQIAISNPEIAFRIKSNGITDILKTNFQSIL